MFICMHNTQKIYLYSYWVASICIAGLFFLNTRFAVDDGRAWWLNENIFNYAWKYICPQPYLLPLQSNYCFISKAYETKKTLFDRNSPLMLKTKLSLSSNH